MDWTGLERSVHPCEQVVWVSFYVEPTEFFAKLSIVGKAELQLVGADLVTTNYYVVNPIILFSRGRRVHRREGARVELKKKIQKFQLF